MFGRLGASKRPHAITRAGPVWYPPPMMKPAVRNRIIIGVVFILAAVFIAIQMFHSMTPPRHADHDHAMAKLDAGGFLWVEQFAGTRRNLVGRPGKVLVLHWFDPAVPDHGEQTMALRFAASVADDPTVDLLFVAQADSWEGLEEWAAAVGMPTERLYLDEGGRTGELIGVRRLPETLVYDPSGLLAFQARGANDWSVAAMKARVDRARAGVDEIA